MNGCKPRWCQDTCERLHTVRSRRQRQRVSDNHTTPDQLFRDRLVSSVLSITTENNSKQRERCSGRHNAPGLYTAVWHACGRCLCTEAADVMFVNGFYATQLFSHYISHKSGSLTFNFTMKRPQPSSHVHDLRLSPATRLSPLVYFNVLLLCVSAL